MQAIAAAIRPVSEYFDEEDARKYRIRPVVGLDARPLGVVDPEPHLPQTGEVQILALEARTPGPPVGRNMLSAAHVDGVLLVDGQVAKRSEEGTYASPVHPDMRVVLPVAACVNEFM